MLIRLTQVTAIFGIGHCFRNPIATTYSGNLSQAYKHELATLAAGRRGVGIERIEVETARE